MFAMNTVIRFLFFFCTLIFWLYPLFSFGQTIGLSSIKDRKDIYPEILYFQDVKGEMTIEEITQPAVQENFVTSDKKIKGSTIGESTFWLRIDLQTNNMPSEYLLEFPLTFISKADFYYQKDNTWQIVRDGCDVKWEDREIKNLFPTFSLQPLQKSSSQTVYLRIRIDSFQTPIYIYQKEYFDEFYFVKNILYGIFTGIILFVIINNLYLFFFFRERTYLYYALLVVSYLIFSGVYEGYFKILFINIPFLYHNYLSLLVFTGILSYVLVPLYTIHFFEFDKKDVISKVSIVFLVYILITLPLCFFPYYAAYNLEIVSFVGLLLTVIIAFKAKRRKYSNSMYFLVAYFSYLIFLILEMMVIEIGIPYVFRLSYISIGVLVEMIILALALSKKFENKQKMLRREKEKIRVENLRLVEEQNIILEEKVKIKTRDLQESYEEISQSNEELQQTHEEMITLNETLSGTYNKLKVTTEQMNSSIRYAQKMQTIFLPLKEDLLCYFENYFSIYLPKDTVSGDFYWFSQISETKTIFALADCTGHGVPGAFMTMIGNTLLHEVVEVKGVESPAHILKNLDSAIRNTLKQNRSSNQDGMDISVCLFEKRKEDILMTIASAKCKTYFKLNNAELEEFGGNKIYLGGKMRKRQEKEFTNLEVSLQKGNIIYFTTDGFADQNNKERKRFGTQNLKEILKDIMNYPLEKQKEELVEALAKHQGIEEQRDDITIVALKV